MPRSAAALLLLATLLACSGEQDGAPLGPAADPGAGPDFALYGIGDLLGAVPRPCVAPEHREFDFWVGKWNIRNPAGVIASTSVITSELDGCVVMEDFIGNGGLQGRSLNIYDARDDRWYQAFVDNVLGNYRIAGNAAPDSMLMTGTQQVFRFATGDFPIRSSRIVWADNPDGTVRQTFFETFDGGPEQVTFNGLYLPAASLDRATPAFFPFCQNVLPGARQLDFWLGEWAVKAADGPVVGASRVTSDLNGCLIEENFEGENGFRSRSFLFYDFVVDRWFRSYADNAGEHVELSGGLENGRMAAWCSPGRSWRPEASACACA